VKEEVTPKVEACRVLSASRSLFVFSFSPNILTGYRPAEGKGFAPKAILDCKRLVHSTALH
jgi:hypothetical protein